MKIAVGTTSEQKLGYLKEVLDELEIIAEIIPIESISGVPDQPISEADTSQGSINRAKSALSKNNNSDLAIGIEVGYHPNDNDNYEMFCYATIIDKNGNQITAQSHKLLLPDFHQNIIKQNKDLGDYVRQFLAENTDEYSQKIGEDIRGRRTFIKSSIKKSLQEYMQK